MKEINILLTPKQKVAWDYLMDSETTEILYGGAAGGGKSFLGCLWIISNCISYPGTRWMIGRARLKDLKESTLLTFWDILKSFGLQINKHYFFNASENVIKFWNGSEVYLKDLFMYPKDPEFDSLGSREYTGALIDEASEIVSKAKNIVMSRLRYKHNEFGLVPKLFICSNPTRNFLYTEFFKPYNNGDLPEYRAFVPALPSENKHLPPSYVDNLKKLDNQTRERLLYGNWDYENDPADLFEIDSLNDIFNLIPEGRDKDDRYLTVDVARKGDDLTVIAYWEGLYLNKMWTEPQSRMDTLAEKIQNIMSAYFIPPRKVIVDEDGVGGGVVDILRVHGFVNNSSPLEEEDNENPNYSNLKAQCYWWLSVYVTQNKIGINKDNPYKEYIVEDLMQVKRKDPDNDGKLALIPKAEMKERLGRSPDYGDTVMMRLYFELEQSPEPYVVGGSLIN